MRKIFTNPKIKIVIKIISIVLILAVSAIFLMMGPMVNVQIGNFKFEKMISGLKLVDLRDKMGAVTFSSLSSLISGLLIGLLIIMVIHFIKSLKSPVKKVELPKQQKVIKNSVVKPTPEPMGSNKDNINIKF